MTTQDARWIQRSNNFSNAILLQEIAHRLLPYTITLSMFASTGDPDLNEQFQRVSATFYGKTLAQSSTGAA